MKIKTLILTLVVAMASTLLFQTEVSAQERFALVQMNNNGSLKTVSSHSTFKEVKRVMDGKNDSNLMITDSSSLSPSKIVAMKGGGFAQSYPYRKGHVNATGVEAGLTANIFLSPNLTGDRTYISAHYQMRYIDTIEHSSGKLIAKVQISGFTGYIDIVKIDLIPNLISEKGISWKIGGNENYYSSPEAPVNMVITPDSYTVAYNSTYKVNELSYRVNLGWPGSGSNIFALGVAPDWLKPGKYYSSDGAVFYTDVRQNNPVKDKSGKVGEYINYFKFLPLRSKSNIAGADLDAYLKAQGYTNSVYAGLGDVFIENGNKYGVNPLIIYSMANLESAFGTSRLARDRFNLFGWNAVDSNPGNATAYEGVSEVVEKHMAHNLRGYTSLNDWRFFGYSVGDKGSGFNTMYASDPYWGMKIAAMAYRLDRSTGFKDLEAYELGKLHDKTSVDVKSSANDSSGNWYRTPNNLINQIITLNKKVGSFYETYSAYPIVNGKIVQYVNSSQNVAINLDNNLGYVNQNKVNPIAKVYRQGPSVIPGTVNPGDGGSTTPEPESYPIHYRITADVGLRIRKEPNTSSGVAGLLSYNSTIYGKKAVNGWVEITYNNQRGYISADYLEDLDSTSYLIGDGNRDGKIDLEDFYAIRFHILETKMISKDMIARYDINGDGKIDLEDFYSVRFHILETKLVTQNQGGE